MAAAPTESMAPVSAAGAPAAAAAPTGTSSLFVGDLHPDVSEARLYEAFQGHGQVASVRVCRDAITRKSLGHAYVNFTSAADAAAAMKALNYTNLGGKDIRIMWAHRDPSQRRAGANNVYVKNLPPTFDTRALANMFEIVGTVTSARVMTDPSGASLCYGFVAFERSEDAAKALTGLNGFEVEGKPLVVQAYVPRAARAKTAEWTNCYVKGFPKAWSNAHLRDVFSAFGEITSAEVMRTVSGESRGFGFVAFKTKEAAEAALTALHDKPVPSVPGVPDEPEGADGRPLLYVARAQKRTERQRELAKQYRSSAPDPSKNANLFVKNLTEEVTDSDLRKHFVRFGTITSAKVMRDPNGASRGFGFVCFSAPEEAQKALSDLHKTMWNGRPLHVSLFQTRDERNQTLERARRMAAASQPAPAMTRPGVPGGTMFAPGMQVGTGVMPGGAVQPNMAMWQQNMMYLMAMGVPPQNAMAMVSQMAAASQQAGKMAAPGMAPGAPGAAAAGMQAPAGMIMGAAAPGARPAPGGAPAAVVGPAVGAPGRGPVPTGAAAPGAVARAPAGGMPVPTGAPVGYPTMAGAARGPVPATTVAPGGARYAAGPPAGAVYPGGAPPARGPAAMPPRGYAAAVITGGAPAAPTMQQFAEQLSRMPADQRRNMLGEKLYPLVCVIDKDRAAKITGMLLDTDTDELLHMLDSREALETRVREAQDVLKSA